MVPRRSISETAKPAPSQEQDEPGNDHEDGDWSRVAATRRGERAGTGGVVAGLAAGGVGVGRTVAAVVPSASTGSAASAGHAGVGTEWGRTAASASRILRGRGIGLRWRHIVRFAGAVSV